MPSGVGTRTHIHTYRCILTSEPRQFQETRYTQATAARAWFNNLSVTLELHGRDLATKSYKCQEQLDHATHLGLMLML